MAINWAGGPCSVCGHDGEILQKYAKDFFLQLRLRRSVSVAMSLVTGGSCSLSAQCTYSIKRRDGRPPHDQEDHKQRQE